MIRLDVPVDPDRDTATQWLRRELAKPDYQDDRSLLQRAWDWFFGLFEGVRVPDIGVPPLQFTLILVGVIALVVLVAWWIAGPVRLSRVRRAGGVVLDEDDARTSAQMRAAADAAAAAGDWSSAVIERFRAVVRSLEERVIIDPRPGRTAQEAAADAGVRLPALADALRRGAGLFDDAEYGKLEATGNDDRVLRELDAAVTAARPEVSAAVGAAPGYAPDQPAPDAPGGAS
ncbi:DUF4129 domain-containing protein [Antribacter gilvus]|uniref:DUF4129 domain-containing protein n=1 Tax=Antribacter gilvus TaxID=2304675 RepID=UPI001F0CCE93|nr:DUF4129 domain-containing protein [Antribacter gilvus]